MSIPENLADLSYSDPLGIEIGDLTDAQAVAADQEVDTTIFGNIKSYFVSGNAAFAYLIFILLYTPCVAAMGAYVREFGARYARFIAVWTMGLAYAGATLYYQSTHFMLSPQPVLRGSKLLPIATFLALRAEGKRQQNTFQEQGI